MCGAGQGRTLSAVCPVSLRSHLRRVRVHVVPERGLGPSQDSGATASARVRATRRARTVPGL